MIVFSAANLLAEDAVFEEDAAPRMVLENGAGEGPAWDPMLGLLFSGEGNIMRLSNAGLAVIVRCSSLGQVPWPVRK